jgi:ABC-type transport system substrate-binding protein
MAHHEYGTLQAPILAEHYWAPIVAEALAPIEALGEHPSQEELLTAQTDAHYILFSHQVDGEPTAGGFTLTKLERGAFLESVKNPDYLNTGLIVQQWENGAYKDSAGIEAGPAPEGDVETEYTVGPHVDSVVYTIYGSQDAAILAMQKGEIDYVLNSLGLHSGLSGKVKGDPNLTVIENPTNSIRYLSFNNRRRPMNDCAFRQAVAVLIDKEFIIEKVLQGAAFPLYTFIPESNIAWYFGDVPKLGKGFSREERVNLAVEILEQAGFYWENDRKPAYSPGDLRVEGAGRLIMPDGTPVPPLKLLAPSPDYDPLRSTFAFWIESWLDEMGIPVMTELAGIKVLTPLIFTEHDFDMYILGWSLDIFPDHLWLYFAEGEAVPNGNNAGGYINPEFETLSSQILTCNDVIRCKEIADQSQIMLSTESPYVMLYSTEIVEAFRSDSLEFPFVEALGGIQYYHLDGNIQPSVEIK